MQRKLQSLLNFILLICLTTIKLNAATPIPDWTQLSPSTSPLARENASMAFDQATGQLILFGGSNGTNDFNDTWNWNGTNWVELIANNPLANPSQREFASMAFDQSTGQLILFGGSNSSAILGDTWNWNGTTWTQLTPANSPSARTSASLAFDPVNGQLILFGGVDSGGFFSETWAWNGTTWTQLTPANSPSARINATMAFDPATGQLILFGGFTSSGLANDTWNWNGTNWINVTPGSGNPPTRSNAVMDFDQATGQMILFGGIGTSGDLNDTWNWNGSSWQELTPSNNPGTRRGATMTYDPGTGQMILFGGNDENGTISNQTWNFGLPCPPSTATWQQLSPSNPPNNRAFGAMAFDPATGQLILNGGLNSPTVRIDDTWNWSGSSWTQLSPPFLPPLRDGASIAFNPASGQLILFGGFNGTSYYNDTWNWTGNTWTQLSPPNLIPSPRRDASMAYDPSTGRLMLFGGFNGSTYLNDTWYWDGTGWHLLIVDNPISLPSSRSGASMSFDQSTGQLILFGGYNGSTYLQDTWQWNATLFDWVALDPATPPPARTNASMAFNGATGQLLLFGGYNGTTALNDTWNWNGTNWELLTVPNPPSPRYGASMAFDEGTGQMILFGGLDNSGNFLQQTWNWAVIAPTVTAIPSSQTICSGGTTEISLISDVFGTVFNWTVVQVGVTGASAGSGDTIAQTLTTIANTTGTVTYTVTPSSPTGCDGTPIEVIVTVNPVPIAIATPSSQEICSGDLTNIALSSNIVGTTFDWTATSVNVTGASDGSGSVIAQILTTTSLSGGTVTYTIIPFSPAGCSGIPIIATVTVRPSPTAIATPPSQSICSGGTTSIALTSLVPGTTFNWTVVQNGVTGALPGNGSQIAQTLTATSNTAGTATYTITTSSSDCPGDPTVVIVTVNPIPTAIATPSSQAICSGKQANIALTSNVVGTTFAWTVTTVNVTGASNGSGANIAQVLSTNSALGGTATYTITPTFSGCPGIPIIATVTVNPSPTAITTPPNQTICSGDATSIALTSLVPGTTFDWTVVQNGVTGASAGSGFEIAQILTTTGNSPGTATYTINSTSASACSGLPTVVIVTVNPIPNVSATPLSQTICGGDATSISLSSNISGTTFNWTVSQNGVTGASNGTGSEIVQILTTTGNTPGTATYTITPTLSSCPGTPILVTVTVNPIPIIVVTPARQIIRSGETASIFLSSTVPGTDFSWTISVNNVSGAFAGSGSIISQTLSTPTGTAGSVTYTITSSSSLGCSPRPITATVVVEPVEPPRDFRGRIRRNEFATQTDIVHALSWQMSPEPDVIGYRIYQNHCLIKIIHRRDIHKLKLHNRRFNETYHYEIVAFTANAESIPAHINL